MVCGFGNHRGLVGEGLLETRWDRDWSGGLGGSRTYLHQVRLVLICSVVFEPKIGFRMVTLLCFGNTLRRDCSEGMGGGVG
jgi:hypothetical protein